MRRIWVMVFMVGGLVCSTGWSWDHSILPSYTAEAEGKLEEATESILEIFRNDPKDYFINLRLGWLFYLRRMYSNSLIHYKKALSEKSQALEPHLGILNIKATEGKWSDVEGEATRLLKRFPSELRLVYLLIRAKVEQKNWMSALSWVDEQLEIFPIDQGLLELKIKVARELGKPEMTKATQEKIQAIYPGTANSVAPRSIDRLPSHLNGV